MTDRVVNPDFHAAACAVQDLLEALGFAACAGDPLPAGLVETPERVARALVEMTEGYHLDPAAILGVTFEAEYDQIVALARIPFVSTCEHHLLPFIGYAGVAYLPQGRVVGLSKLARLVDVYAKRLQLQERMTQQIAVAMMDHLNPRGALVLVEAEHSCMACRGVKKPGAVMRTSAVRGTFLTDPTAKDEAMRLLQEKV